MGSSGGSLDCGRLEWAWVGGRQVIFNSLRSVRFSYYAPRQLSDASEVYLAGIHVFMYLYPIALLRGGGYVERGAHPKCGESLFSCFCSRTGSIPRNAFLDSVGGICPFLKPFLAILVCGSVMGFRYNCGEGA